MELPAGLDYAWLGCDVDGYVARFTNAGSGPVPVAVLARRDLADRADALTRTLPFVGKHEMRVRLPDPTDFSRLARRGLYGYDWQDAVRTAGHTGCYELLACPLRPLRCEELPPELQRLAELVRLVGVRFSDCGPVPVGRLPECVA
jgi:hypothetical protein